MTEETQILPCPFCGKKARSWRQGFIRKLLVACSDNECGAYFIKCPPEEWNTRTPPKTDWIDMIADTAVKVFNDFYQSCGSREQSLRGVIDYLAQREMLQGGWMPIESAPMDGTRITIREEVGGKEWAAYFHNGDGSHAAHGWLSYPGNAGLHPLHWKPDIPPQAATDEGV